jgi:hypothetical protein
MVTLGSTQFSDFVHRPILQRTRRFGNCICFSSQLRGTEKHSLLVPLEISNLNDLSSHVSAKPDPFYGTSCYLEYLTMDKAQKLDKVVFVSCVLLQYHCHRVKSNLYL